MSGYENYQHLKSFGPSVQARAIGSPPGTSMQPQMLEQLRDIASKLNLAQVGISTPWAARVSDLEWRELKAPDTNVVTFLINDADMTRAQEAMFGSPLPFVVIKTLDPVSVAALQNALQNTAYEFFESFAVYRQDDPNPVPRIEFHHWARRLDLDEEGSGSMSAAAALDLERG